MKDEMFIEISERSMRAGDASLHTSGSQPKDHHRPRENSRDDLHPSQVKVREDTARSIIQKENQAKYQGGATTGSDEDGARPGGRMKSGTCIATFPEQQTTAGKIRRKGKIHRELVGHKAAETEPVNFQNGLGIINHRTDIGEDLGYRGHSKNTEGDETERKNGRGKNKPGG